MTNPANPSPAKALMTLRIIWLGIMMGQLIFLGIVVCGAFPLPHPVHPNPLFPWINLAMLLVLVPIAFVIRTFIFKNARIDGKVPPRAYSIGNIIFWASCEGVSFTGLVFTIINGSLFPTIYMVAVALALQVITFPIGERNSRI